jgi:nicotinate-nucleotide pyrophosphorylase (carboxylating)
MKIIEEALKEDIGMEDITTNSIVSNEEKLKAVLLAKEDGVIAGLDIAKEVFITLNKDIKFEKEIEDGTSVKKGKIIAKIEGNARAVLTGERVALNFLQRLSGIATLTRKFVQLAGGKIKIKDTRKTTPGLRVLEKYAVKVGGGTNHRMRLDDGILIKDNHIAFAGGIAEAIRRVKNLGKEIEVEVENINELKEALDAKADSILLDNMKVGEIKKAVKIAKGIETEISGGVNLKNIKKFAKTGATYISVGALTHSPRGLDISLEVIK